MNKSIYILLLLVLGVLGAWGKSVAPQQYGYKGPLKITPVRLEQLGDSLYVAICFDLDSIKVRSRRSIDLMPMLVAPPKKRTLPWISVQGRLNHLGFERKQALMGKKARAAYRQDAPYWVVEGFPTRQGASKKMLYTQTLPFKAWMVNARLDIRADLNGCGNTPQTILFHTQQGVALEPIEAPYVVQPVVSYVQPQAEPIKRREARAEAFLDFAVGKVDIRANYMNNPRELQKITDLLSELFSDSTIQIRSINVEGWASPEGSYAGNRRLSENRARALVGYLSPQFRAAKGVYRVSYGGENWQGLRKAVEGLEEFPYKGAVEELLIEPIESVDALQSAAYKRQITALGGGAPYQYLLRTVYPSLRKAICTIDYVIRGFEVDLARRVIKTKPQNLSLNELFLVANTYPKGSAEFIEVFDIAVRLYPDDPTANLNAASAALERGNVALASTYLARVDGRLTGPELDNAQGVLALLQGEYPTAERYLRLAAEGGSVAAVANLEQLTKKQESVERIEIQQRRLIPSHDDQ